MTRLPNLQRALIDAAAELDAAEARTAPAVARRRGAHRSTARVLAIAVVVALALAAIAVAATGLLQRGTDVAPRSGRAPRPTTALGVATGMIAPPITVPDPEDDHLRWGLRTFTTTRGYACLQVGRVQDFQLGVVGRDGAFGDDGRFHVLGPQVLDETDCVPLDRTGHGFLALHYAAYPASGLQASCVVFAGVVPPQTHRERCPDRDLRTLDYGLLGPHATSITYRLPSGAQRTARVHRGTGGAFLVVTPSTPPKPLSAGALYVEGQVPDQTFLTGQTPSALTIVSVAYDDGTVCRVDHTYRGSRGGCPLRGFSSVRVRRPRHAEVATRMRLSITREADGRHRDLHVAFRARYPARGSRAAYYVFITPPGGRCPSDREGHVIEQDVRAGQRVGARIRLTDGGCPGLYGVELSYRVATRHPVTAGVSNLHYPGTAVASGFVTTP
jgi:hypothetical protein